MMLSVQPSFFAQLYQPRVRYTGLSLAYQLSSVVGGFTPLLALWLLHVSGNAPWPVALFLFAVAALSFACARAGLKAHRFTR
jgi:hypothetical protein